MRHREMLAHLQRLLKNHYDTKTPINPAYAGQIAAEIQQQLLRHKGVMQHVCACEVGSCYKHKLESNQYCYDDREAAGLAQGKACESATNRGEA